ncbi:MAG: alpha/beta fold hydrolase [Holophagales bacterium]|nr:alpha/beta fold hydrolase [Holophagales bacterium]
MQDFSWVDRRAYPFQARDFESEDGRMSYVDEGQGHPIVMVHGTPTWSFLYRHQIRALSRRYRCIAPDHLGFGLSDKPDRATYRPADHARRLKALIEHLELGEFTLVVHDFGGPIGLSYAMGKPDQIHSLVVLNTWMWSLRGELIPESAGIFGSGRLGTFVFQTLDFELRILFRMVWGQKSKLTRAIHQQYLGPFSRAADRRGITCFARELRDSSPWYEELWQQRKRIADIPALILWGKKDLLFGSRHLERWQNVLTNAETVSFPEAGHFVQEEAGEALAGPIERLLGVQRVDVA